MRASAAPWLPLLLSLAALAGAEPPSDSGDVGSATSASEAPTEAEECHRLVENGRFHLAVDVCQRALREMGEKKDPRMEETLLRLAEAQEGSGSPWLAVNSLQRILDEIKTDAAQAKARIRMSRLRRKFGEFELARAEAEKIALREHKEELLKEAVAAEQLYQQTEKDAKDGKWRKVEETCRDLIVGHTPYSKRVYDLRIGALSALKEWQRAIDSARSKARIETDSSETDLLIGKLYLSMGNVVTGRKFVTECAKLNPENRKCLSLRSKLKHFDAVLEEAEKVLLLKDAVEALEGLLKLVEGVPEDEPFYDANFPHLFVGFRSPVLKLLCTKQARRKNLEEAVRTCEEARKLDSANQELYLLRLGEVHLAAEKFEEAIKYLQQAQRISPRDREVSELLQKAEKARREKMRTKHYTVLGVRPDATVEEIKKAHSRLVRKWHPDKQATEEQRQAVQEKIHEINAAYDVLSNPKKRQMYDAGHDPNDPEAGRGGFRGGPFGGGGGGGMHFNFDDLASMFNQGGRGGGFGGHWAGGHHGGGGHRRGGGGRHQHHEYYGHEDL